MKRLACCLAVVAIAAIAGSVQAGVIGTWDGSPDGWIDWGNLESVDSATNMPAKYNYASVSGSPALQLTQSGWNQNLSIKLQDNGLIGDFMANSVLKIDLTVPETTVDGWSKIEGITLNAEGASWGDYGVSEPAFFGWGGGSGGGAAQSATLEFDYSAYLSDPDVVALGRDPYWVEIIVTTNDDGNHPDFFFQNARLERVPEPASLVLLGLGLVAVFVRRR